MDLLALAQECAPSVAPDTVLAIVQAESAGHPWALNINAPVPRVRPETKDEAVRVASSLVEAGFSVDMGLMQVNSQHLETLGLSIGELYEPCHNVGVGALILTQNYRQAVAEGTADPLLAALSAYNTGSFRRGFTNGYVARVVRSPVPSLATNAERVTGIRVAAFGHQATAGGGSTRVAAFDHAWSGHGRQEAIPGRSARVAAFDAESHVTQ